MEKQSGKPMLYVNMSKALYGTLHVALLFWRLLSDTLTEWGSKLNKFNKCITNKTIKGKQCTIRGCQSSIINYLTSNFFLCEISSDGTCWVFWVWVFWVFL